MNPKIIFFDIDGTLVDPATGLIPESAYTALKLLRENGIMICIATGRPIGSLPDLRDQEFDAMVTFNGSLCYTGEKTIYHCPIPYETVQKVIANAASVGRLAYEKVKAGQVLHYNDLHPEYMRKAEAEEKLAAGQLPICQLPKQE